MSSPRWRQPGKRRAAAESEGEADGRPTEVLITGILARCWAGEINLQRFSHCGNCWLMLDSSVALSHYLSPVISQPFRRSRLYPIPLHPSILFITSSSPDFSLPLLLLGHSVEATPLPRFVFTELAGNNGHIKHKWTHVTRLITAFFEQPFVFVLVALLELLQ